jgi:DNA-binding PadR family transcriptional regulator
MIDLAILGVLSDEELHGYELTKRLADVLRPGSAVSFGSVYPALSRLERRNMVKAVEAARSQMAPIPMTGSLAGELAAARSQLDAAPKGRRARKVYGITAQGDDHLVELLLDPGGAATSAAFDLRLALFHHLDREQRLELIRRRLAVLESRREQVWQSEAPTDRYQLARQVRELAVIEHDMTWLADLAAAETTGPDTSADADADDDGSKARRTSSTRTRAQNTTADAASDILEGNHD